MEHWGKKIAPRIKIRVVKEVVYKDMYGTVTRILKPGDILECGGLVNGIYYNYSYGGLYKDSEAVECDVNTQVTSLDDILLRVPQLK
jgi:hypothetical protein